MSGTATSGYLTTLPSYAQYIKNSFLKQLGINSTDPDEIHSQLIALPYQALVDANHVLLESTGLAAFCPVVESQFDGVTRILDDDPEVLLANGRGNNYPMLLGFTNNECAALTNSLKEMDVVDKIKINAIAILPAKLLHSISPEEQVAGAKQMLDRYFNGTPSLDEYLPACSDSLFVYPALKLAETRLTTGGAPLYMYQFSYGSPTCPVQQAFGFHYKGAGHTDDLSYVLRVNSVLNDTVLNDRDEEVKDWMTDIITNFVDCK
jgi:carboxylesterase type B